MLSFAARFALQAVTLLVLGPGSHPVIEPELQRHFVTEMPTARRFELAGQTVTLPLHSHVEFSSHSSHLLNDSRARKNHDPLG